MNPYPHTISIEGETLDYLKNHSELIAILLENQNNQDALELDCDILFGGDNEKWHLFLDLFFPEEGYAKLFDVLNNSTMRVKNSRGGEEALMDMLRYMMVNEPGTELEFAINQARRQINAPAVVAPRGVGVRAPLRFVRRNNNNNNNRNEYPHNFNNNNNRVFPNNDNENTDNNVRLGYTNEEESMLGRLKGQAAKTYYPNEGGKRRRTRRTRKVKKVKMGTKKSRRVRSRTQTRRK